MRCFDFMLKYRPPTCVSVPADWTRSSAGFEFAIGPLPCSVNAQFQTYGLLAKAVAPPGMIAAFTLNECDQVDVLLACICLKYPRASNGKIVSWMGEIA